MSLPPLFRPGITALALHVAAITFHGSVLAATGPEDLTDLSLEQLVQLEIPNVSGASKHEQKANEAPASVSVITAEDIRRHGYVRLGEALASVRGFYIRNERTYEFLGTRGFNRQSDFLSRILVLIDGHRLNDSVYQQGPFSDFPLDLDLIDRIEVIRGPGSSLYGSSAFFGVINIITRRGATLNGAEVSLGGGSYETLQGRASYGARLESGLDLLVSVSGFRSNGNDALFYPEVASDPAYNLGVSDANDSERRTGAYLAARHGDFTFSYVQSSRIKYAGTTFFETTFNNTDSYQLDQHRFLDLQFQHRVDSKQEFFARLFWDYYYYRGNYLYPGSVNRDYADSRWWGAELRHRFTPAAGHDMTLGAEYIDYFRSNIGNHDIEPPRFVFESNRGFSTLGLFIQDDWRLRKDVTINLGVRHDRLDAGNSALSPRAGLIVRAWEAASVKLLAGSAFRAPNDYEQYYVSDLYKANSNISPERIRTYEAVLEQGMGPHLRGLISMYRYDIRDLISEVEDPSDGLLYNRNLDRVRGQGQELELEVRYPFLEGRVSFSHQDARDATTHAQLSDSPRRLIKLSALTPLADGRLWLGWETQYISGRLNPDGIRQGGYSVSNLSLTARDRNKRMELSASIFNLFDKTYAHPSSNDFDPAIRAIPQDGRSFRVKATNRF